MTTKNRTKQGLKKKVETNGGSDPLAEEVTTYESHVPGWADREGQFVLIKGREVLGFFPRYEEALEAGYDRFEASRFLVKQILMREPIYQLGRVEL
jgi:hypothetical protein